MHLFKKYPDQNILDLQKTTEGVGSGGGEVECNTADRMKVFIKGKAYKSKYQGFGPSCNGNDDFVLCPSCKMWFWHLSFSRKLTRNEEFIAKLQLVMIPIGIAFTV